MDIRDVGTRRELFVDHYLVDRIDGQAALRMHPPKREEVVFQVEGAMENACSGVYNVLVESEIRAGVERRGELPFAAVEEEEPGRPPAGRGAEVPPSPGRVHDFCPVVALT